MKITRAGLAVVAWSTMLNPVMAQNCVSPSAAMAMKTAAVQQQLMVAAFMCNDAANYNRFVIAYQPELRASDAALKAHFVRTTGGETGYDAYKSKVANGSALSQGRNGEAFCSATDRLFAEAFGSRASLTAFISTAPPPPGLGEICILEGDRAVRLSQAESH